MATESAQFFRLMALILCQCMVSFVSDVKSNCQNTRGVSLYKGMLSNSSRASPNSLCEMYSF